MSTDGGIDQIDCGADSDRRVVGGATDPTATTTACETEVELGTDCLPLVIGQDSQLRYCDLARTDLADSNLRGADLTGANLTGANISGVDMTGAILVDAVLTGATVSGTSLVYVRDLDGVRSGGISGTPKAMTFCTRDICGQRIVPWGWYFQNGYLVGPAANLRSADLANTHLSGVQLFGADLTSADLRGAELSNSYLRYLVLADADLTGASLYYVKSGGIVGAPAALPEDWHFHNGYLVGAGAYLYGADLPGADLAGADLTGVILHYASLPDANLMNTNFTDANLVRADLTRADLRLSNLTDADLAAATMTDADVTDAVWSNTKCPDGTNSDSNGSTCIGHLEGV